MFSEKTMLIIGQLFIVVLAAILAVAPRLYTVAIVLYFALIMGFGFYRSRSAGGRKVDRAEVEQAQTLFREEKSFELAVEDDEYIKMVQKQMKSMFISLALFPVYIIIFQGARSLQGTVAEHLAAYGVSDERIAVFLVWLAAFESMFLLNQALRRLIGGTAQPAPIVPAGYRVTRKGIIFKGGLGQVIAFPLPENTEIKLDETRNYVELKMPRGMRIRLYTRKARRLYEIIQRYGLGRGGAGSGGDRE